MYLSDSILKPDTEDSSSPTAAPCHKDKESRDECSCETSLLIMFTRETWEGSASFSDYFYSGLYKLQLQKTAIKLNETL